MPKDHRSFFERLTGSVKAEEEEENNNRFSEIESAAEKNRPTKSLKPQKEEWLPESEEGQLAVDVFNAPNEIIIQSMVAGVKPDDLDVSITQDMVTIRGQRQKHHETRTDDYYYQELYWGGFSRSVMLPQEVDVEASEAAIKDGLLTVRLPKLDRNRVQKLKVEREKER
jgi:HSP20 family protein